MAHAELQFDKRLKRIVRKHNKMRHGVAAVMTRDGLIVARPRRRAPRFPLQGLVLLLAAGFFFKGLMLFSLGGTDYDTRVASLSSGTAVEQAGAWVLSPDPITVWVAHTLNWLIH